MKSEKKAINGIIYSNKGKIVFSANGFSFTFMNSQPKDGPVILNVDECGYIWGTTYDNKIIAIYAEKDMEIKGERVLNTWNYIVSRSTMCIDVMKRFKMIRFKNGIIKTVFPCNALHERLDNVEKGTLVYEINKDCTQCEINVNQKTTLWRFSSIVNQKNSITEGNMLSNSDSILEILFDEEQELRSLNKYINYVHSLCAFLTFRDNIGYEKISLLYDEYYEFAECFIKYPEQLVVRDFMSIINIRCLEENILEKIILNILAVDKEHNGLPIPIIPKDDRDAVMIDVGKIRTICSVLEMELDNGGVTIETSAEMNNLISSVKDLIKDIRKSSKLSPKTFDYIFGNISHWGQPLAEKVWSAWNQHYEEVQILMDVYNIKIDEKKIQEFVKARNSMTHAGATDISTELAETSFILMGLIYCCTMTRLGISREQIKDIMRRRLIG